VKVAPEEGYGVRDEALVQQVPRRSFQGVRDLKAGMQFHAQTAQGPVAVTVTKVQGDMITVDGNHALAGVALNFDDGSDEGARSHRRRTHARHVHGASGHHH
jgi:FKBP-type peptidyl-prolyl cis-trans isomerase SlyD